MPSPSSRPIWVRRRASHGSDVGFNLIYSATLLDHLGDTEASGLLDRLVARLASGGRLVVGNYTPENYARGYMEGVMGWSVFCRREVDLERLAVSRKLKRFHIPGRVGKHCLPGGLRRQSAMRFLALWPVWASMIFSENRCILFQIMMVRARQSTRLTVSGGCEA
jgi:hypothetical protein